MSTSEAVCCYNKLIRTMPMLDTGFCSLSLHISTVCEFRLSLDHEHMAEKATPLTMLRAVRPHQNDGK